MSDETGRRSDPKNIRDSLSVTREVANRETLQIYEFGPFRLEPTERKLMRGKEMVALTPKVFDTLLILVRNSGHLMEKDVLLRMLWPDSFVEEGSLSNSVFMLRKALGEDPAFIETVPRRGYRFVGAVRQLPHTASPQESSIDEKPEWGNEIPEGGLPLGAHVVAAVQAIRAQWRVFSVTAAAASVMLVIATFLWFQRPSHLPDRSQWVELTQFPDSVSQPAFSADGRMLTFIRGDSTFFGPGQVYVKLLPNGQPVALTHDSSEKMSPAFSPDGARVAYTTVDSDFSWDTWVVPTLRGEAQPWLRNASGLVWRGPQQVLFSKMRSSPHMGIVTAAESRVGERDVYIPSADTGMAHRSYPSPDGKSVLLAEMNLDHIWIPCRLVPMDGTSKGYQVGPPVAACRSAAWSPDGKWMYLTSEAAGINHIWRQRFPDGRLEQVTSGPTEEEGIAMAPDGRSFVTAVALENVSLWLHDGRGERQISLEGNATEPKFTPDGKKLCYRIVLKAPNFFQFSRTPGEVWVADLESGRSAPVASGFQSLAYDLSVDGKQVVFEVEDREGKPQLWITSFDQQTPPRQVPNVEGRQPKFGLGNEIFFRNTEGYVYRVRSDGTAMQKAVEPPILSLAAVSPDSRWLVAWSRSSDDAHAAMHAFPLAGGTPVHICHRISWQWSSNGRFLSLSQLPFAEGRRSYIIPLPAGEDLPQIPAAGYSSEEQIARLPGALMVDALRAIPGPSAGVFAFARGTTQRNLYRIPIP
jgi:DNA-binding winged helix-turn-helix (wHTH) protein/Tol biopolymer transport system component